MSSLRIANEIHCRTVLLKCRSVQSAVTAEVESGGRLVALLSLIMATFLISSHYEY